uniref:(northern house mosquito) hypothetical protein n=1 Tax=Culex pipiens TaxID=7175 RepID=A0A8D8EWH2_CULPI
MSHRNDPLSVLRDPHRFLDREQRQVLQPDPRPNPGMHHPTDLVLLVVRQCLIADSVNAQHVLVDELVQVEHARPVKDHPPPIAIPLRQRKHVPQIQQFGHLRIATVQPRKQLPVPRTPQQNVPLDRVLHDRDAELFRPQKLQEEVGIHPDLGDARVLLGPLAQHLEGVIAAGVRFAEFLLGQLAELLAERELVVFVGGRERFGVLHRCGVGPFYIKMIYLVRDSIILLLINH